MSEPVIVVYAPFEPDRTATRHEFAAGKNLADALMDISPTRWHNAHVELYDGGMMAPNRVELEEAPRRTLEAGDRYFVAVMPAAGIGAAVGGLVSTVGSVISAGGLGSALLWGGVALAGTLLLKLLAPKPRLSGPTGPTDTPTPLNAFSPPSNISRLGARIPDLYGRMRTWPDLIFPAVEEWPWGGTGREQTLQAVYCITRGTCEIDQVLVGDTPIEDITGATVATYEPGDRLPSTFKLVRRSPTFQQVTLDMPQDGGGFTDWTRVPGGLNEELWVDIAFPNGAKTFEYKYGSSTGYRHKLDINWRAIDPYTGAVGVTQAEAVEKWRNSYDPLRFTRKISVAPGTYEMRFQRTDDELIKADGGTWDQFQRGVQIVAVSGVTPLTSEQRTADNVTLVKLDIQGGGGEAAVNLNAQSRFNMRAYRKLRAVAGATYGTTLVTTRKWRDAVAHMLTDSELGAFPEDEIDFQSLANVWDHMKARVSETGGEGGHFNALFDRVISVDDQLQTAARVARASIYHDGVQIVATSDKRADLDWDGTALGVEEQVVALFNRRNRAVGDLEAGRSIRMTLPNDTDGVELSWIDSDGKYLQRTYTYAPSGTPLNPYREECVGLTNWSQVYRYARYVYQRNKLRRYSQNLAAFEEARLAQVGDVVSVVDPWREDVVSGEVLRYTAVGRIVQLDRPRGTLPASPMIRLRAPDGRATDLIGITAGVADDEVVLDRDPLIDVITGTPTGQLGMLYTITTSADDTARQWLVIGADAQADGGTLTLANYNADIFAGDTEALPERPGLPFDPGAGESSVFFATSSRIFYYRPGIGAWEELTAPASLGGRLLFHGDALWCGTMRWNESTLTWDSLGSNLSAYSQVVDGELYFSKGGQGMFQWDTGTDTVVQLGTVAPTYTGYFFKHNGNLAAVNGLTPNIDVVSWREWNGSSWSTISGDKPRYMPSHIVELDGEWIASFIKDKDSPLAGNPRGWVKLNLPDWDQYDPSNFYADTPNNRVKYASWKEGNPPRMDVYQSTAYAPGKEYSAGGALLPGIFTLTNDTVSRLVTVESSTDPTNARVKEVRVQQIGGTFQLLFCGLFDTVDGVDVNPNAAGHTICMYSDDNLITFPTPSTGETRQIIVTPRAIVTQ